MSAVDKLASDFIYLTETCVDMALLIARATQIAAPADAVLNYLEEKSWTGLPELQIPQQVQTCR